MAFGPAIDIPFIVGGFVLMAVYRKRLSSAILRIGLPAVLLFVLVSIPLIIVEEDIDCMPAWCNHVIVPPTLPFILFEVIVLGALTLLLGVRSLLRVMAAWCVFGVGWELTVGGLVGAPILVDVVIGPYVAIGYGYVALLPIQVLLDAKASGRPLFGGLDFISRKSQS
ncbi:MAG TPA: hypothetical protein VKF15_06970 [Nitrososphaerales archaeon]|nr:hypothetical protein [Nitrososphaerales archaeon]